jgi:hypothetical protein
LTPTVGIAATGFCNPGGILQLFGRENPQILRLPTAAAGSHLAESSSIHLQLLRLRVGAQLQSDTSTTVTALCFASTCSFINVRGLDQNTARAQSAERI